jgi:L-alanine-DL-glutamate epimerase-like enolase superfamily enzyme
MNHDRRSFMGFSAGAGAWALAQPRPVRGAESAPAVAARPVDDGLDEAAARQVFDPSQFREPVLIDSVELLKSGSDHFVRVRSKDGAVGISVDNGRAGVLAPIFTKLVAPYFIGKDAREIEELLFGVYRQGDNYKYQGLALWCCVALVEFAILDMLGRIAKQPIAALLGGVVRDGVPFYVASGRRDTTPEEEIDYLRSLIAQAGAKAVKYRVGGRMSRNEDASPGRTETLIPLSRKALGDEMAIHADSNSSYDPEHALPVGRMLEDIGALYFEEPCPFDDFEATKQVTDALKIPIALGEQESSHARFRDMIRRGVADIVQPDLFYYGGLVRSIRVARMAAVRSLPTTVHLSGGFGFVYSLHFAACTPNIGPWQEYKLGVEKYGPWFDPPLSIVDGKLVVPTGPGVGIDDINAVLKDAVAV